MCETDLVSIINSKIKWGRYKRKKIKDIPIDYLVMQSKNLKTCSDETLIDFIEKNLIILKQSLLEGKTYVKDISFSQENKHIEYVVPDDYKIKKVTNFEKNQEVKCSTGKKGFSSQKDANTSIKTIRNHSKTKYEIPVRSYLCDICKSWHLTSRHEKEWEGKRKKK